MPSISEWTTTKDRDIVAENGVSHKIGLISVLIAKELVFGTCERYEGFHPSLGAAGGISYFGKPRSFPSEMVRACSQGTKSYIQLNGGHL